MNPPSNMNYPAFGRCARNMAEDTPTPANQSEADVRGGGNLNGSSALLFFGQAGTAGVRISVPRQVAGAGNAGTDGTGIV